MPIHVSEAFTWNVTVAFVLMWLGAALGLAVSIWMEQAGMRGRGAHAPLAFPVCCAAAIGLFSVGVIWQLIGYLRLDCTTWWTW